MDDRTTEDLFPEDTKKIEDGTDTNVGTESDELVSRRAVIKSVTREYNRRRTGDGLKLAWIEKAINGTPSAQPEIIRCNSCKHWTQTTGKMKGYGLGRCDYLNADLVTCNGFCYWAERRNDEID